MPGGSHPPGVINTLIQLAPAHLALVSFDSDQQKEEHEHKECTSDLECSPNVDLAFRVVSQNLVPLVLR